MMLQRIEVTTVLHKKFDHIFDEVLPAALVDASLSGRVGARKEPSQARLARRRKTDIEDRRLLIKQFVWTLFLYAKGRLATLITHPLSGYLRGLPGDQTKPNPASRHPEAHPMCARTRLLLSAFICTHR